MGSGHTVYARVRGDYVTSSSKLTFAQGLPPRARGLRLEVHYWFPFAEAGRQALEILRPNHIGLIHVPVEQEHIPAEAFDGLDEHFTLLMDAGHELELHKEPEAER